MISVRTVLATAVLFGVSTAAAALEVKSAAAAGSVCKASDGIKVSASEQAMSINLPDLKTQSPGKRIARANCSVSVNITDSGARQFRPVKAIFHHDTLGTAADELTLNVSTWFQGKAETPGSQIKLKPGSGMKTEAAFNGTIWSPCTKELTYNLSLGVIAKSKAGLGAESGMVFKDPVTIEWEWQSCKP